jgi:hypothetical protein
MCGTCQCIILIYLILQNAGQKDYIVHLARTPPPFKIMEETLISSTVLTEQNTADRYIKFVKDIPTNWIADHAKHVC